MFVVMLTAGGMVVAQTGLGLGAAAPEAAFAPVDARPGTAPFVLLGFTVMCILPLVPGLLEVVRPRDRYPLPVDLDFARDPHYLGTSLRGLLRGALPADDPAVGVHAVTLSRPEQVRVTGDLALAAGERCTQVLVVRGDLCGAENVYCEREIYCAGRAVLGDGARLRALAADADVILGVNVEVLRWLDTAGELRAGPDSSLGRHCAARGRILLASGCRFARLHGAPIQTPGAEPRPAPVALTPRSAPLRPDAAEHRRTIDQVLRYERGDLALPAGANVDGDVVVRGDLAVGAGAVIAGSVRAGGGVRLDTGTEVRGSVFADGPVMLGRGVAIAGHVFSQDTVAVAADVQIGRPGAVKSLVGNRGVTLAERVVVHGHVLTAGEGLVRCTGD
jgi:hypothetical protein